MNVMIITDADIMLNCIQDHLKNQRRNLYYRKKMGRGVSVPPPPSLEKIARCKVSVPNAICMVWSPKIFIFYLCVLLNGYFICQQIKGTTSVKD